MKRINGHLHYFGRWGELVKGILTQLPNNGLPLALDLYLAQVDDIQAGRKPRAYVVDGKVAARPLPED